MLFVVLGSLFFIQVAKAPILPTEVPLPTSINDKTVYQDILEPSQSNPYPFLTPTILFIEETEEAVIKLEPSVMNPTRTRPTICDGPANMIILAIGIDRRTDGYDYGLADVIRIVRVDFISGGITVLTLPRDLWVEIPGLKESGVAEGRLSQVYYFGSEYFGAYHEPDYGPGLMMETLNINYGLNIDRYVTVNMQSLERIIDTIGGVDVYLPYDVDGKSTDSDDPFDLGYFPTGNHHFNGETAVRFARIRMMDNDYYRTMRQSLILKAMWKKILTPHILPEVPELISHLSGTIRMNLKLEDIQPLVCLIPMLDESTPIFANIPLEMLQEGRIYDSRFKNLVYAYQVNLPDFRLLIQEFQEGSWPVVNP